MQRRLPSRSSPLHTRSRRCPPRSRPAGVDPGGPAARLPQPQSLQRLMHLWRAYEGPERFDCLSIGKVARWGQIRPQHALSLPQSPFDYEIVLHG